ncbi:38189_t:CDS:2 [Gigaspora margarita]|uniref:38189_t:CDS:1 n=1 Tax=Gigaspora margarita TaxID=4874 RepID=A0ABM8VYY8_GIGMA|nr:38189_t:CDS:2 [Gigaspora margarita]
MAVEPELLTAIHKIQNPIPQFALGSLPAIATIGTTPHNGLRAKFMWFMRSLGRPFTGLPVGHYAMKIKADEIQKRIMNDWVTEASLLDRLSSLVSAYYILVGIFAGIFKAAGPCMSDSSLQNWPYIPLLLIWTLPAIYVRIKNGKVVNKVLPECLGNKIIIKNYKQGKIKTKRAHVAITAFASVALPWLAVIVAYFTRPIGFFCRSKYLTVICSIWSFNSVVAYICHIIGEKDEYGHRLTHKWFRVCGVFITGALILLSLLANTKSWWIDIFGDICMFHLYVHNQSSLLCVNVSFK